MNIPFNEKAIDMWHKIYQRLEMGYSMENLRNASLCLYYFTVLSLYPDKHVTSESIGKPDIITETITNMRSNIDKKLTVEDMANKHKLSGSHFSMLFSKSTGMPPLDYFTHLKMQKACQLIYANESKIKEIALSLGYDDPYYFSRFSEKIWDSRLNNTAWQQKRWPRILEFNYIRNTFKELLSKWG